MRETRVALKSLELQTFHLSACTPLPYEIKELDGSSAILLISKAYALARSSLIVVIAWSAFLQKAPVIESLASYRPDPFGFCFGGRLNTSGFLQFCVLN